MKQCACNLECASFACILHNASLEPYAVKVVGCRRDDLHGQRSRCECDGQKINFHTHLEMKTISTECHWPAKPPNHTNISKTKSV